MSLEHALKHTRSVTTPLATAVSKAAAANSDIASFTTYRKGPLLTSVWVTLECKMNKYGCLMFTYFFIVFSSRHLAKRYVTLDGAGVDPNAFWPGHLLDKIRLCVTDEDKPQTDSIFTSTRTTRRRAYPEYNNHLKWWPISDQGYMMPADYEQNKVYSIDNR